MEGTVFDKLRRFKLLVSKGFDKIDDQSLFRACAKLSTWHYPKKRTKHMGLSMDQAKVIFMSNDLLSLAYQTP